MKKIIIFIVIFTLLLGCSNNDKKEVDAIKFKKEYESLNNEETSYGNNAYRELDIDEENPFIYKSAKDIVKMIDNKETFVVYFGFSSCPWCRSVIENLINVSSDLGIDYIYYVDVLEIRDTLKLDDNNEIITSKEGTDDYYKLLEKLDNVLDDYTLTTKDGKEVNTNEKRIYAPNIISVVDGVPTKMTTGISDLQTDAYMELTEEMIDESYDKINCTIECAVEKNNVCMSDKKC